MSSFYNYLFVDVEQVGRGDTEVVITYLDDLGVDAVGKPEIIAQENGALLHVTSLGLIYDRSYDTINCLWVQGVFFIAELVIVIITLTLSFLEKRRNGDFSYRMVTQGGAIIFLTGTAISLTVYTLIMNLDFLPLLRIQGLLQDVLESAQAFVGLTIIPLLIFDALLSISNIWLVRHEGFRVQNLLGILLGVASVGGIAALYLLGNAMMTFSFTEYVIYHLLAIELAYLFSYFECLLFSTVICAVAAAKYQVKEPMDYLIILGCAIRGDGSPTPLLRARIDSALAFDREQAERLGHNAKFVPSGGQGSDEVISEAESMKRCLMEQGVAEERILKEDKSVNTYENMAFSKKVIEADAGDISRARIAFSTTNYHVFRGYTLAQQVGMKVRGLSAKTKLYFFPNAFLREFIGLLWNQKGRHLLFFVVSSLTMVLAYCVINF